MGTSSGQGVWCVTLQSLASGLRGAILTGIHPPELHSLVSHMQPKLLCMQDRGSLPGFCPCYFFCSGRLFQVLGLLIFTHNSSCRVVIPKAQYRASRLLKKQNGTMDQQSKTSELRRPQCQAEPDGYSTCLSYATLSTSTVCSACSSRML